VWGGGAYHNRGPEWLGLVLSFPLYIFIPIKKMSNKILLFTFLFDYSKSNKKTKKSKQNCFKCEAILSWIALLSKYSQLKLAYH